MPQIQPLGSHLEHTQPHTTTHCMYRSSSCVTQTHTHSVRQSLPTHLGAAFCFFFFSPAHSSDLTHHHTFTHMHTYRHTDSVTQIHRHTPIPQSHISSPRHIHICSVTHTLSCSLSYKDTHSHRIRHTQTHNHGCAHTRFTLAHMCTLIQSQAVTLAHGHGQKVTQL